MKSATIITLLFALIAAAVAEEQPVVRKRQLKALISKKGLLQAGHLVGSTMMLLKWHQWSSPTA